MKHSKKLRSVNDTFANHKKVFEDLKRRIEEAREHYLTRLDTIRVAILQKQEKEYQKLQEHFDSDVVDKSVDWLEHVDYQSLYELYKDLAKFEFKMFYLHRIESLYDRLQEDKDPGGDGDGDGGKEKAEID